jgi:flagellin
MGALINRFQYTVDNLTNISVNASESKSRVTDTNYAQATADLAKYQIVQQAATAMLAQANQQPQQVLTLLK